ncbi:MAG: response regulator [Oscillatoriophycideae cyanobacterium NC_groundwater_1537_Pr4_S-0.65um_50_18]|nr:response regulator [Oscillatoriophycideae cyanobacterium NC_groundwater_1537_Pr4_S-0.65um_50_18]
MKTVRVVIVEDEILIAREIEGCLNELGYNVVGIAADADAALQQIAETQPDLALIDIVIQGEQDGIALAKQVRDRYQIPVIYLTAYVDNHTLSRAKLTHPFGYVLKPFSKNDLHVAIEIALAHHQIETEEKAALFASLERYIKAAENPDSGSQFPQPFEYLSVLSHELRNPISTIQVSIAILEEYGNQIDEEKKRQLLHQIKAAATSMNQLIEDVLTLGQAEHSTASFQPEMTDIVEFCHILLEPFQWNIDKQHTIEFNYPSDCIQARIDKKLLWHALSNLVGNALKYSPDEGIVSLGLYCTEQELCFEVQDQGIGILPEDVEHLFKPFHRGRNVGKLPGTGLGLAIAERAVELHSGEIAVASQVGYGTTFIIKLPLHH